MARSMRERISLVAVLGALVLCSISGVLVDLPGALAFEAGSVPPGTWTLRVDGSRLSVDAHNAPLGGVLSELASRASFSVFLKEQVAQEPVVAQFSNLPLEEGLRRLLQGKEYAIIHGGAVSSGRREGRRAIREVLVFSGRRATATEADAWIDYSQAPAPSITQLTQRAFQARTPVERARALEELRGVARDEDFTSILGRALGDEDAGVRGLALELLEETLSPIPEGPVAQVVRHDASPELRAKALSLVAYRMEDRGVDLIRQALQDPDSRVQALAGALLDDLGVGGHEQEGPPLDASNLDDAVEPSALE